MFENVITVAQNVATLFMLMSVGFILNKGHLLTKEAVKGLVNVLIYVVTPCLIIHSFRAHPFEPRLMKNLITAFFLAFGAHALGIVLAHLFIRTQERLRVSVLKCAIVFSNAGFMGIPLEYAILGTDGVFYGITYVVVFNLMFWTWGFVTFSGSFKEIKLRALILNPGSLGVLMGLPFFLFSWNLPTCLGEPIKMLADLNTPLAMLAVGFNLGEAKWKEAFTEKLVYVISTVRLIVIPSLFFLGLVLLAHMGCVWEPNMAVALMIASCAPIAAFTAIFAVRFEHDVALAVELVTASTLFSILTMPPLVALALAFFS